MLEIEHKDVCYVSAIDVALDDAGDTGNTRSIAAEETLPEMHVLSRECYVSTP